MPRERLRPVDLAREHGLSTQAIRNYEQAGILPPAGRTPHGYRVYTRLHAGALRAFAALLPGHGHQRATSIMRAVNLGAVEDAMILIDESHTQLLDDRRTLLAVERALRDLSPERPPRAPHDLSSERPPRAPHDLSPERPPRMPHDLSPAGPPRAPHQPSPAEPHGPHEPGVTFIGPLARRLGIRPATLRKWERAGLVRPHRDPRTGYRVYTAADVRDARLAHQLRRGGYLLEQIAPLLEQVRAAGGVEPLEAALSDWRDRLATRGRAMLRGAAELDAYLRGRDTPESPQHAAARTDPARPA
ncbi:MerR family transcriptional regulator [Nonomuraea sp. K274]|uniref:MerR family transcriptional regulator n=1 Tax=Nonomuraea cypriaca TaxID=1187855 RepID=A0A931ACZ5_9ACTN|nr:TioE family transcriptional regulator [Nonomuraea cypriaca]MBF8189315.1 MerR family transcriptional regulator [Nonomuraea cypriaca]